MRTKELTIIKTIINEFNDILIYFTFDYNNYYLLAGMPEGEQNYIHIYEDDNEEFPTSLKSVWGTEVTESSCLNAIDDFVKSL